MQETRIWSQGRENSLEKRLSTGNLLQYSCLENSTNRGVWLATVHRVAKSWTQLSDSYTHTYTHTHTIPLQPKELPLALNFEHVQWKIIHSFSSSDNVFISSSFLNRYSSMNTQFFQHLKKKTRRKVLLLGSSIVSEENSVVTWIIVCCLPLAAFKIVLFRQVHYVF